ncbi:hypothetical protein N665_2917s0004 [Sinapis alba]|nr:hypothetical protein N665_2917s0004 [Sinapis alba]
MEKTALIFIGILLFSTCTLILAQNELRTCWKNSDCVGLKCPGKHGQPTCVDTDCECPIQNYGALPDDTNCGVAACSDYCKAKGEVAYACLFNHCYCRKPPM